MMPCSSGNSPTMPVTRSALQSRAACVDLRGVGARHELGDLAGELAMRSTRSAWVPSLAWKTMSFSAGSRSSSAQLAVLVPEELGVAQPRAQHALVAVDDGLAAVARHDVGDDDEAVGELAVLRGRREIALVRPHGDDQHLGRHVHELRVDGAEHRHRPFDQAGHFVEQPVVGLERDLRLGAELFGARRARSSCARPDRGSRAPPRAWPRSRRSPPP